MTYVVKKNSAVGLARLALVSLATLALLACGGGGGSAGSSGTVDPNPPVPPVTTTGGTITLDLLDATGVPKTAVTTASPLTARATVKDAAGKPIANTVVAFAVGPTYTVLAPLSGTALTDASGVARVTVSIKSLAVAQSEAGAADFVQAAVTIGDQAVLAKTAYQVGTTAITLKLVAPSPSTISLNAYDTTPIKVDVFADGVLYTAQPVTVNFGSACANGKADLPASALTINGRAQVVYRDKGCSANDTVTASVPGAPSVTATLAIAAPVPASIGFVSGSPSNQAIVIKGAGGNGRVETAILTFKALDSFGNPLPNQLVTFSLNSSAPVSLQSTSATTGTDGTVLVAVNSGTTPTTFRVIASLASGQSTLSDTITVTTGQPVQTAFSLSAASFNIEGWDYDGIKTTLTALMADVSGNPVADGTPVVFQTNRGAVGSSINGGCVTTNGGCTVDFRSQAPRGPLPGEPVTRAGMATIAVSSTSATASLTGNIYVFLSGSQATAYATPSGPLSTAQCGNFSLQLEIVDVNGNPMPEGTALAAVNTDKVAIGTIFPATVPSIAPTALFTAVPYVPTFPAARQGSFHIIPVKPDPATCNVLGTPGKGFGTFGISVTTPKGNGVVFSFSLAYPSF